MEFWVLRSPERPVPAEWDESVDLEGVTCPVNPGHQRAGKRLGDLRIVLPNRKPDDFVWTWYSDLLIGENAIAILRRAKITGFMTKPVEAHFRNGEKTSEGFRELVVTGWGGMARPESGIQLDQKQSCDVCGMLRYTGLKYPQEIVDESQWDGSDIFMVWPLPAYPIVTRRFVDIVREHRLSGLKCLPIDKLEQTEGYSPGRLSYSMPEDRARMLGVPLGIE
jgi:hypothetical protein